MRLQIITPLHWWYAHYDQKLRQPIRCGGSICGYCDSGREPELRFVLGCVHGTTGRGLLELRERHRRFLEQLVEQPNNGLGCIIHVSKRGSALNSPVDVELVGQRPCEPWDIRLLVEQLGLPPVAVIERAGSAPVLITDQPSNPSDLII